MRGDFARMHAWLENRSCIDHIGAAPRRRRKMSNASPGG
jgi:hypothetical protein